MPKVSTGPFQNSVVPIFGSYAFGPNDTYASIQISATFPATDLGGIIVSLPGPQSAVPGSPVTGEAIPPNLLALPRNGDFYKVADPRAAISDSKNVTIWGGGYQLFDPFAAELRDFITMEIPGSDLEFTFDDAAQVWIVSNCANVVPD